MESIIISHTNTVNNKVTNLHINKLLCTDNSKEYMDNIITFLSCAHELFFIVEDNKYDLYELMAYDQDLIYKLGLDNHIHHLHQSIVAYHEHQEISKARDI